MADESFNDHDASGADFAICTTLSLLPSKESLEVKVQKFKEVQRDTAISLLAEALQGEDDSDDEDTEAVANLVMHAARSMIPMKRAEEVKYRRPGA